jgi:hypothetical protein
VIKDLRSRAGNVLMEQMFFESRENSEGLKQKCPILSEGVQEFNPYFKKDGET